MKTWNNYLEHVRNIDDDNRALMGEIDDLTEIVRTLIEKRTAMGISQRQLAEMCHVPQSSIARIESGKTTPKLDTLIKLLHPLGLKVKLANISY